MQKANPTTHDMNERRLTLIHLIKVKAARKQMSRGEWDETNEMI
jgi:hypothetical protein